MIVNLLMINGNVVDIVLFLIGINSCTRVKAANYILKRILALIKMGQRLWLVQTETDNLPHVCSITSFNYWSMKCVYNQCNKLKHLIRSPFFKTAGYLCYATEKYKRTAKGLLGNIQYQKSDERIRMRAPQFTWSY